MYLAHGFDIIGMYGEAVMMAVHNVDDESVRKALKQLTIREHIPPAYFTINQFWSGQPGT